MNRNPLRALTLATSIITLVSCAGPQTRGPDVEHGFITMFKGVGHLVLSPMQIAWGLVEGIAALPYYAGTSINQANEGLVRARARITLDDTYQSAYSKRLTQVGPEGDTGEIFRRMRDASEYFQRVLKQYGVPDAAYYILTSIDTANQEGYTLFAIVYRPTFSITVIDKYDGKSIRQFNREDQLFYEPFLTDANGKPLDTIIDWAGFPIEYYQTQKQQAVLLTLAANAVAEGRKRSDYWVAEKHWIAGGFLDIVKQQKARMESAMGIARVWPQPAVKPLPTTPILRIEPGEHTAMVSSIDTDATGRVLVMGSLDKTVRVWSLPKGQLLNTLRLPIGAGNEGQVYAVAISPDGTTVAAGGWTGYEWDQSVSIYLFDRSSGQLVRRLTGLPDAILDLAYSRDGRYLAAGLVGKNGIRIYRTDDWQLVAEDHDYGDASPSVDFAADGRLVSASHDGFIRLYGPDFRLLLKKMAPGGKQPSDARFSPDGARIAVGFDDTPAVNVLGARGLQLLYAPHTGILIPMVSRLMRLGSGGSADLRSVAWSQDGRFLYASGRYVNPNPLRVFAGALRLYPELDMMILRWRDGGRGPPEYLPASYNTITDLHALADGKLAYTASDPAFGVFDAAGHKILHQSSSIANFRGNPTGLLLSHDGRTVQFGFEYEGRRPAHFSIDRRILTLLSADSSQATDLKPPRTKAPGLTITDWENTTHPKLNGKPLESYGNISRSLAIAPDGHHFLLGTEGYLHYFDHEGNELGSIAAPGRNALGVNIAGNGELAVAALGDGTLRWYRLTDSKELLAFFPHADGRRWVLWTPEGFFDAKGGGEALIGYHLNQGPDQVGEFVKVDQLYDLFYRPDLVARSLTNEGQRAIQAEVARIGDVWKVLAGGLPPELELVSSRQEGLNLLLEFKVKDRGGGVGKIVYRINGVEQEARPVAVGLPGHTPIRVSLPLPLGQSRVEISAYNKDNTIESRSIETKPNIDASVLSRPSLYVLALGVSSYRDPSMALKYAAKDAKALAGELKQRGQRLFQSIHIQPLLDRKVTLQSINAAFDRLADQVKENDVFVLFLAGHGIVLSDVYHFIPADAIYRNEQALREASLDKQRLQDLLKEIRAQKSLLILDTCYAGAASKLASLTTAAAARGDLSEKTAITKLMRATGRAVLAASSDKQLALEGHQGHGFFTFALLQGLKGQADLNKNGEISTLELAEFVSHEVPKITRDRQFPIHESQGLPFPIGIAR